VFANYNPPLITSGITSEVADCVRVHKRIISNQSYVTTNVIPAIGAAIKKGNQKPEILKFEDRED
jgi:hypothetical protein